MVLVPAGHRKAFAGDERRALHSFGRASRARLLPQLEVKEGRCSPDFYNQFFYHQRRNRLRANPKLWAAEQKKTKETGFWTKLLGSWINHSPGDTTSGIPVMWANKLPYCLKPSESASLLLALETILTDTTTLSWFLDVTTGH